MLFRSDAYRMFDEHDTEAIPIVSDDGEILGVAEKSTLDHYVHTRIIELHRKLEKLG